MGRSRKPRTARHQTGRGPDPRLASLGGLMADTPRTGGPTGDHRADFGGRKRSAGGEDGARTVFQPSNGKSHRFQSPKIPARFTGNSLRVCGNCTVVRHCLPDARVISCFVA